MYNKSEEIDKLAAALCKFQGEMPVLSFDATVRVRSKSGAEYSFKYATLQNIVTTAKPYLEKNGLSVIQLVGTNTVTTVLMHSSGQWVSIECEVKQTEPGAQAFGSAVTYIKRYQYSAILGIVADEDDDANITDGNTLEKRSVSEDIRPWINDKQVEQVIQRLSNGENPDELLSNVEKNFRLSRVNRSKIMEAINLIKQSS